MNLSKLLAQDTVTVAKQLLGWTFQFKSKNGMVGGIIAETEAYTEDDPACHAYKGKQTKRNQIMFQSTGHIYIYFIYGMYHCINIVTEEKGTGAAVLIREIIPTIGLETIKKNRPKIQKDQELLNGPSKLMIGLDIPASLNGIHLSDHDCPITLTPPTEPIKLTQHPRIGISKATEQLWRFRLSHPKSM